MSKKEETKSTFSEEERKLLMEELERPPIWEPKENDIIFGVLHSIRPTTVKDKQKSGEMTKIDLLVVDIYNESNESIRLGIWKGTVLDKKISELGIVPGDKIAISYYGKTKAESGKEYENYGIAVLK